MEYLPWFIFKRSLKHFFRFQGVFFVSYELFYSRQFNKAKTLKLFIQCNLFASQKTFFLMENKNEVIGTCTDCERDVYIPYFRTLSDWIFCLGCGLTKDLGDWGQFHSYQLLVFIRNAKDEEMLK